MYNICIVMYRYIYMLADVYYIFNNTINNYYYNIYIYINLKEV